MQFSNKKAMAKLGLPNMAFSVIVHADGFKNCKKRLEKFSLHARNVIGTFRRNKKSIGPTF